MFSKILHREEHFLSVKKNLCFSIFLFTNLLFCVKYISKYTDWYIPITFLLLLSLSVIYFFNNHQKIFASKYLPMFNYCVLGLYVILNIFLLSKISIHTLNVDRWSVITSFWQNFEKGEYVYFATSHESHHPGPMPFYFILTYPFYYANELGLFSLLTLPVFLLLMKYCRLKVQLQTKILLLLVASPFIWWELICRSNLLINGLLVLFSIVYFFKSHHIDKKRLIISSILFGLLLSTRNVFSIAYIIVCLYAIKVRYITLKQAIIMANVSFLAFSISFLPFIVNHWEDFLSMNPFIIQSTFVMPFKYVILFPFLAILFGWFCNKLSDIYFYISVTLFLCIFTYLIYMVISNGFWDSFYGNNTDISYFLFAIPFALFYIYNTKKERLIYND